MDDKAASYWGERYFAQDFNRAEWQAHPRARERLHRIQGERYREAWFADTYLGGRGVSRALGIGVGRAETEIALMRIGAVDHYTLYDISPVGLEHAKEQAMKFGFGDRVECVCGDFNDIDPSHVNFDLVTFVASLHHFADLDGVLRKVKSILKPDGYLWAANEYVGPDRFAYPPEHRRIVETFYDGIPVRYRKHGLPQIQFPTAKDVEDNDPSESPASSQILDALHGVFNDVDILELYGTFAFILFWGLNHDALYETAEGAGFMDAVLAIDKALVTTRLLPCYFIHAVARNSAGAVASVSEPVSGAVDDADRAATIGSGVPSTPSSFLRAILPWSKRRDGAR